jgi:hypothetical protein
MAKGSTLHTFGYFAVASRSCHVGFNFQVFFAPAGEFNGVAAHVPRHHSALASRFDVLGSSGQLSTFA